MQTYWIKVEANGETFEKLYLRYGDECQVRGSFKNLPEPGCALDDGLFEVTLIKRPKNPLELNEIIASLLMQEDHEPHRFVQDRPHHHRVQQEISWTLDSEYSGDHGYVCIEARKHAMELVLNNK